MCIRTIIDYAAPVFHYALPLYLVNELECLQKCAMRIICPNVEYSHALSILGLPTINDHHDNICTRTINNIVNNSEHKLNNLLPKPSECKNYNLRHVTKFLIPRFRTNRFRDSFIIKSAIRENNQL